MLHSGPVQPLCFQSLVDPKLVPNSDQSEECEHRLIPPPLIEETSSSGSEGYDIGDDENYRSQNSLSARSMSSLATTVDSKDIHVETKDEESDYFDAVSSATSVVKQSHNSSATELTPHGSQTFVAPKLAGYGLKISTQQVVSEDISPLQPNTPTTPTTTRSPTSSILPPTSNNVVHGPPARQNSVYGPPPTQNSIHGPPPTQNSIHGPPTQNNVHGANKVHGAPPTANNGHGAPPTSNNGHGAPPTSNNVYGIPNGILVVPDKKSPTILPRVNGQHVNGRHSSSSLVTGKAITTNNRILLPTEGLPRPDVRNSIESTLSLEAPPPNQVALLRSQSSTSSTSLPSLGGRSFSGTRFSSSKDGAMMIPAPSNVRLNQTLVEVAANRSSVSSQHSIASSNPDSSRRLSFSAYSHRTSFSFSRRRNTTLALPNTQVDDTSASVLEIERLREAIVTQRETKRRRREFLEDERVLVGTKVSEGHVNFVTAYNMLTGIRVSVSRCNAKVNRDLVDGDFSARNKLAFDIQGNELAPSAKFDFKFKDYSPWVFRHLREMFKLDPADYLMSLTSKYIVSELGSPGKSGSFFYFSRDYRFIIKTIHHSEHKMLRKILKEYYNHVKNNPNTLISQFYGLHRVKLPFGRKIHFIVMNNLFPPHRDVHCTFDLKGSTLGRRLVERPGKTSKRSVVYKDLDWLARNEKLRLGPTKRSQFLHQLEIDVALLKRLNIMDYSLLIGIHDLTRGNTENIRDSTLQVFEPGTTLSKVKVAELRKALVSASPTTLAELNFVLDEYQRNDFVFYADSGGFRSTDENDQPLTDIYYLGIIDCLTPYTFVKRVETFFKGLSHNHTSISAVPAAEYGDRFRKFIKSVVSPAPPLIAVPSPVATADRRHSSGMHLPVLSEASTEGRSIISSR
jgi:1-phosphatidylinositol-4-phosphate 5-kinase